MQPTANSVAFIENLSVPQSCPRRLIAGVRPCNFGKAGTKGYLGDTWQLDLFNQMVCVVALYQCDLAQLEIEEERMEQAIQLLMAGVGLILSYVVWTSSKRIARAQYQQTMQETWNEYNLAVLDKEENLRIAKWFLSSWDSSRPADLDPERVKYLAFIALNAIQSAFLGKREGLMDSSYADSNIEQLLSRLVFKEEIFQLTQLSGYHPEFMSKCAALRIETLKKQAVISGEDVNQKQFPPTSA